MIPEAGGCEGHEVRWATPLLPGTCPSQAPLWVAPPATCCTWELWGGCEHFECPARRDRDPGPGSGCQDGLASRVPWSSCPWPAPGSGHCPEAWAVAFISGQAPLWHRTIPRGQSGCRGNASHRLIGRLGSGRESRLGCRGRLHRLVGGPAPPLPLAQGGKGRGWWGGQAVSGQGSAQATAGWQEAGGPWSPLTWALWAPVLPGAS